MRLGGGFRSSAVLAPFETLSPSLFSAALVKADATTPDVACQLSEAKVAAVDDAVIFLFRRLVERAR